MVLHVGKRTDAAGVLLSKRVMNQAKLLILASCASCLLITGCARVSTETAYVFAAEDAVDNPALKDNLCKDVHAYKGQEPTYFAKYYPSPDLGVRLQLLAPRKQHTMGIGPGVILPMPLIPNPWGGVQSAYYHSVPEKEFGHFVVAVYPDPFTQGYSFTPSQVRLDIGGKSLQPTRITRHYTVNLEPRVQVHGLSRERLKVRNGEFDAFVIEFDTTNVVNPAATLHMSGFDHNGKSLGAYDYLLSIKRSTRFDWEHDVDCQN